MHPCSPNACGVPVLLTDGMPHRYGTFRREDVILFKRLRERATGRVLSLVEVFRDHPDLAQGFNFEANDVEIVDNTAEEILEAVQEAAALARGELVLSAEDERLVELFRTLPDGSMHMAYHENRPPLAELRRLAPELDAAAPRAALA